MNTDNDFSVAMLNERVNGLDKWIDLTEMKVEPDVVLLHFRDTAVQFMGRIIIYGNENGKILVVENCRNRSIFQR